MKVFNKIAKWPGEIPLIDLNILVKRLWPENLIRHHPVPFCLPHLE